MTPSNLYPAIRPRIQPADVIAFGGRGFISSGIRLFTRSAVSHVATVRRTDEDRVLLVESTTLDGKKGVQQNWGSERIAAYDGAVWWLPLSLETRRHLDLERFFACLDSFTARQIPYDYRQCLRMAFAPLAHIPGLGILRNHEDLSKVFCSELVAAALEWGGALPFGSDPSDVTPQDLIEMELYESCVQVKGADRALRGFNSRPVYGAKHQAASA